MSKLNQAFKLLLSDTGFVFMASTMASGFSFLTSALMNHVLNNSDFGIFGSCMTLYNYTVILGTTIQTSSTRSIAQLKVRSGAAGIKHFYWPAIFSLTRIGAVLFFIFAAISIPIASFLQVSPWLVLLVFSCAVLFGPQAMTTGALQGLQSFRFFGISLNVLSFGRLVASVMLAIAGLGIWGSIVALPISIVASIAANLFLVRLAIRNQFGAKAETAEIPQEVLADENEMLHHPLRTFLTTSFFALFGMVSFALLTGLDIIIVRHFFPNDIAGHYASVSFLGKIVLYFAGPIGLVALPKLSHAHELGQNLVPIFRRNFWLTIAAGLLPIAILAVAGKPILHLYAGYSSDELALLIPLYSAVMLLYSLVALWIYLFIASGRNGYMFMVLAAALLEIGLLFVFHANLTEIVLALGFPALLLWVAGEVELRFYLRSYHKLNAAGGMVAVARPIDLTIEPTINTPPTASTVVPVEKI
jgi:O-antigen/teichoic acid export membrane protein